MTLFVCASFVWLMTELQHKKRGTVFHWVKNRRKYVATPPINTDKAFYPPSCTFGECLWEQSFSHCLSGSHVFIWRSYKRQWRKKLMTMGFSPFFLFFFCVCGVSLFFFWCGFFLIVVFVLVFLLFFLFPWIGRAREKAHCFLGEKHCECLISLPSSLKKISVELQKAHHHAPRILDISPSYQNCKNSGFMKRKKKALTEKVCLSQP